MKKIQDLKGRPLLLFVTHGALHGSGSKRGALDSRSLAESRKGDESMAVITITNDNFEQEVLAEKLPVVLNFQR